MQLFQCFNKYKLCINIRSGGTAPLFFKSAVDKRKYSALSSGCLDPQRISLMIVRQQAVDSTGNCGGAKTFLCSECQISTALTEIKCLLPISYCNVIQDRMCGKYEARSSSILDICNCTKSEHNNYDADIFRALLCLYFLRLNRSFPFASPLRCIYA